MPDFPISVAVLQNARWFTPNVLNALLDFLRVLYFPIVSARDQGFALLTSVTTSRPFAIYPATVRFLSPGIFVTESDVLLSRILSQIGSALQFKDRLTETTSQKGVVVVSSMTPAYQSAQASYMSALRALTDYVNNFSNYWTRERFERQYALSFS